MAVPGNTVPVVLVAGLVTVVVMVVLPPPVSTHVSEPAGPLAELVPFASGEVSVMDAEAPAGGAPAGAGVAGLAGLDGLGSAMAMAISLWVLLGR